MGGRRSASLNEVRLSAGCFNAVFSLASRVRGSLRIESAQSGFRTACSTRIRDGRGSNLVFNFVFRPVGYVVRGGRWRGSRRAVLDARRPTGRTDPAGGTTTSRPLAARSIIFASGAIRTRSKLYSHPGEAARVRSAPPPVWNNSDDVVAYVDRFRMWYICR